MPLPLSKNLPSVIFHTLLATGLCAIVFIFGLAWWMSETTDDVAEENSHRLVSSALRSLIERTEVSQADYSYWQQHFDWLRADDADALRSSVGVGAANGSTFDLIYLTDHEGNPRYAYTLGNEYSDVSVVSDDIAKTYAHVLRGTEVEAYRTVSGYGRIADDIYALSAGWALPNDFADLARDEIPLMIGGVKLSQDVIEAISGEYLIDDLEIVDSAPEGGDGLSGDFLLEGVDGAAVAHVTWRLPKPGQTMKQRAMPAIALLSVILILGVMVAGRASSAQAVEIIREKEHAREAARTDSLTGLMNRTGLNDLMSDAGMRQAVARGKAAVLFMDINGFKQLNDLAGHNGGDQALFTMAQRLLDAVRPGDYVARVGGDEFVAIVLDDNPAWAADSLCERIETQTSAPVRVGDDMQLVRAAIGVAVAEEGSEFEDLMVRADVAMYRAKPDKASASVIYSDELRDSHEWQRSVEQRLRLGLRQIGTSDNPFAICFQPVMDLTTGDMSYAEVLLRWKDKSLGPVSPENFVPIAEARGLVPDLGDFVLRECCKLMKDIPDLRVSVNVSPLQLIDPDFPETTCSIVEATGIEPSRIMLEITESALIEVPETSRSRIASLDAAGFRFALDDFGTGYASISYLKQFNFHTLKIDRSFVDGIGSDPHERDLFSTLVNLGNNFGLTIVAEGIETAAQAEAAKMCGCFLHQGYYYEKPVAIADLAPYFSRANGAEAAS